MDRVAACGPCQGWPLLSSCVAADAFKDTPACVQQQVVHGVQLRTGPFVVQGMGDFVAMHGGLVLRARVMCNAWGQNCSHGVHTIHAHR